MAITYTGHQTGNSGKTLAVKHEGCVIETRKFQANRNMSDTLDYSDWRTVECHEALVYLGRTRNEFSYDLGKHVERPAAVHELFGWIDVSNHFAWRGADLMHAEVDAFPFGVVKNPNMLADYEAWKADCAEQEKKQIAKFAAHEAAEQARKAQEGKDRPERGKRMKVVSGRKVPIGHTGTVAYVIKNGNVLLKDDSDWQDRKADGVWVMRRHLRAI